MTIGGTATIVRISGAAMIVRTIQPVVPHSNASSIQLRPW
jgi:hypothetical protein